jgi:shikimate kinase
MKPNITLIGMPGSGKSTVGIILAKKLSLGFIDTDIVIQMGQEQSLQEIIEESGYLHLRRIEEQEILKISVQNYVIATGGSAVYSEKAMSHLQDISNIVFLEVDFDTCTKRIHNFETRGIAKSETQSFRDLFDERQLLYRKYAELTVDSNTLDQEETAELIASGLGEL